MAETYLNPAKLMYEGREAMNRAAAAAEQPEQPAAQPPGAPPGEKFREWMPAPSHLRNVLNWQEEAGSWHRPWEPYLSWASRHNPAILAGLKTAEAKLAEARKNAVAGSSDIKVINAQSALARSYHFLESAYEASFKTRRR